MGVVQKKAVNDGRYLEVIEILNKKLDDGMIIVERPHHKLSKLEFCKKGKPSIAATKRFNEILSNIKANKDNKWYNVKHNMLIH